MINESGIIMWNSNNQNNWFNTLEIQMFNTIFTNRKSGKINVQENDF